MLDEPDRLGARAALAEEGAQARRERFEEGNEARGVAVVLLAEVLGRLEQLGQGGAGAAARGPRLGGERGHRRRERSQVRRGREGGAEEGPGALPGLGWREEADEPPERRRR